MGKILWVLIILILIFQLAFPVAAFAKTNKGLKSAFLKFSLKDVTNADDVKLTFTSEADSIQKAAVYGVTNTWNESTLTYSSSADIANGEIAGELLGYVDIQKGTHTNTVDVSSFAHLEKINHEKDDFGLAIVPVEKTGLKNNFDNETDNTLKCLGSGKAPSENVSVSDTHAYYYGGSGSGAAEISSDFSKESGGKSLKYTSTDQRRLKFYNTFKATELNADDLNKSYEISFYVYSLSSGTVTVGMMSANAGAGTDENPTSSYSKNFYDGYNQSSSQTFDISANKWTKCSYIYKIDQTNINERIANLTLTHTCGTIYIDDLCVTRLDEFKVYSKESKESAYILHDGITTMVSEDTYIDSGDNLKTNFGTSENLYVGNIIEKTKSEAVYGSSFNFEDASAFEGYTICSDENNTYLGEKSLKNEGSSTISLLNTLKNDELSNDDLDKEFLVSFYVKSKDGAKIEVGYDVLSEFDIPKDKWVKIKFTYTITEDIIKNKKDVLLINHPSTVYIDDLTVTPLPLAAYNYNPISLECQSVIYKTKDGTDAYNLVADGSIDRIFITNNTSKNVKVIVALYNNNVLESAKTLEVFYDGVYDIKMSLPNDVTNAEVKVFALDKTNISPFITNVSNSLNDTKATLYTVGDSLMQTCDVNTSSQRGWTQMLDIAGYFNENLTLDNSFAKGGASTATAISGGTVKSVIDKLKPGDFIIFQFGHNDDYRKLTEPGYGNSFFNNFKAMIEGARSKGAYPLVATSVARFDFNPDGSVLTKMDNFMDTTRLIGKLFDVPVIDIHELTKNDIDGKKSEYRNHYLSDNRHLSELGATWVCDNFVKEIKRLNHPLCKYLTK